MITEINTKRQSVDEVKTSSVIGLITNYKSKGMFEARLIEKENEDKKYVYLKVGGEDFYIDLDENDILANLFSEQEMASIIEELIIENLRLETNLRIASQSLSEKEAIVLELSAKGYDAKQLSSKTGLTQPAIEVIKMSICKALKKTDFQETLDFLKIKKLQ